VSHPPSFNNLQLTIQSDTFQTSCLVPRRNFISLKDLNMSGADIAVVADKRLALAEAGGLEESCQNVPQVPRCSIGNPAPLGLLCFGMTTGEFWHDHW
jgi:hypothetical protein